MFKKINPNRPSNSVIKIQYDYLNAYFDIYYGSPQFI